MEKGICIISFLLFSMFGYSQIQIPLSDVSKHVGEVVNVCGKVYGASLLENVKNKPTLMNLGGTSANERIELRIRFEDRKNFSYNPEALFLNRNVCLTGKITKEHGYAEMLMDKVNSTKLLNEAIALSHDTSLHLAVAPAETTAKKTNRIIKTFTNAYLLTGPSLNESIITWLKAGSTVLVDYSQKGWSYVKVVENTSNPANKPWLYGFVRNQALGLSRRKRLLN